jgi:hypothetical protein
MNSYSRAYVRRSVVTVCTLHRTYSLQHAYVRYSSHQQHRASPAGRSPQIYTTLDTASVCNMQGCNAPSGLGNNLANCLECRPPITYTYYVGQRHRQYIGNNSPSWEELACRPPATPTSPRSNSRLALRRQTDEVRARNHLYTILPSLSPSLCCPSSFPFISASPPGSRHMLAFLSFCFIVLVTAVHPSHNTKCY